MYFFIHPIYNIFGEPQTGLFVGSIAAGFWVLPSAKILFVSSAMTMLAFTDLFITLTICLLCNKNGYLKITRNVSILNILGCFFIFSSPFFQSWLTPYITWSYDKGYYPITFFLVWMVGRYHSVFPLVGYGFFAANLTMNVALDVDETKIKAKIYPWGYFFLLISALSYPLGLWEDQGTNVLSFGLVCLNLGLQILLFTWLMFKFDYSINREKINRQWIFLRRWGLVSLSSFFLEGIIANVLLQILKLIFGSELVQTPLFLVFVFGPMLMVIWLRFLRYWQYFDFRYSIEWLMALSNLKKLPFFERTNIMKINEVLYFPAGLKLIKRKTIPLTEDEKITLLFPLPKNN